MDEKEFDRYLFQMMDAISHTGESVLPDDFPKNLIDDEDFMVDACNECFGVFRFASDRLKNDKKSLLRMVKDSDFRILSCVDKAIFDDEIFMREAVQIFGDVFEYASPRLKKDRELIKLAISAPCVDFEDADNFTPLQCVDESFRSDRELALLAVKHNPYAYKYVSPELQNDKEIASIVVVPYPGFFGYLPETLKNDKELALFAVKHNYEVFEYISPELQKDEEVKAAYRKARKDAGLPEEDEELKVPEIKVGDMIRITNMVGAQELEGKVGVVERIDIIGQLHGTWGKTPVLPDVDGFEIVDDDLPF